MYLPVMLVGEAYLLKVRNERGEVIALIYISMGILSKSKIVRGYAHNGYYGVLIVAITSISSR